MNPFIIIIIFSIIIDTVLRKLLNKFSFTLLKAFILYATVHKSIANRLVNNKDGTVVDNPFEPSLGRSLECGTYSWLERFIVLEFLYHD